MIVRVLGGLLGVLVLVTGCTPAGPRDPSSGQVTSSATTDAFGIKVGDCTADLGSGTITGITLLPCAQPHWWEAYFSTQLTDATYPGSTQLDEEAQAACQDAFTDFVGVSTDDSKYTFTYLAPTEQTWTNNSDRAVLCLAGLNAGGIKGSLKGIKK